MLVIVLPTHSVDLAPDVVIDRTPVMSPAFDNSTVLSSSSAPVVPFHRAIAVLVEVAGPTTLPKAAGTITVTAFVSMLTVTTCKKSAASVPTA